MSWTLTVDSREAESTCQSFKANGLTFERAMLPVGDFCFRFGDQTIMLLERKTGADLAASLTDGRYHEQKARLLAATDVPHRGYIVEGPYPEAGIRAGGRQVPRTTLDSVIIGITVRDGLTVYRTDNLAHTAQLLAKLLNKLPEYASQSADAETVKYEKGLLRSSNLAGSKRANLTPEFCYWAQLAQIPGVSLDTAKVIAQTYPNLRCLLDRATVTDLAELMLAKRRLGVSLAERIIEYLRPSEPEPTPRLKIKLRNPALAG
jgi:ERCC4-type nuclease